MFCEPDRLQQQSANAHMILRRRNNYFQIDLVPMMEIVNVYCATGSDFFYII
jgi:hypothetical protein